MAEQKQMGQRSTSPAAGQVAVEAAGEGPTPMGPRMSGYFTLRPRRRWDLLPYSLDELTTFGETVKRRRALLRTYPRRHNVGCSSSVLVIFVASPMWCSSGVGHSLHAEGSAQKRTFKQDYEYERKGTANLFMLFEPLVGKRYIQTSAHRMPLTGHKL